MKHTIFSILFTVLIASGLFAQKANIDTEQLDRYIQKAQINWEIPGLAISIINDGEVIFEKGYGLRNIEKKQPVTPQTLFAVASNTKSFTAAALSKLVEQGRIEWDEPVRKYLPYFTLYDPYVSEAITVRDLLCHRAGFETFSGDLLWYGSSYTRDEIIRRARFLKPKYGFRTHYGYSNVMFIAAGEIIPAVTDTSWEDYIKHHFLKPLDMNSSNVSITEFSKNDNIAQPYHVVPGSEPVRLPYINWDNMAPAGAINSSAAEMSHWLMMQLNEGAYKGERILAEEQIEIMHTPHTIKPVSKNAQQLWPGKHFEAYALGWNTFDYRGMKIVEHGGGADGMISKTVLIPETDFGFVILTNSINYLPSALMYYILDMHANAEPRDWSSFYHNFFMNRYVEEQKELAQAEAERNKKSEPSLDIEAYTGTYAGDLYGAAEVKAVNGSLVLDFIPSPLFIGDLSHWQYNTFKIVLRDRPNLPPGTVNFILDENGKVDEMRVDIPNPDFDFTELEFYKVK
jgi:CubicO group peptidase (beta-lactamase class C family)